MYVVPGGTIFPPPFTGFTFTDDPLHIFETKFCTNGAAVTVTVNGFDVAVQVTLFNTLVEIT